MAKRRSRFAFAWFGCFGGQARAKKMAEEGYPVKLHIYDLSQGMARQLSATILDKAIEAIWHTGVVVYGREYYFGGGIQQGQPGRTPYGTPIRVEDLGVTHVPREVFEDFLQEIGPRYTPATYNLLSHNCNNFSDEAAQFLTGARLPSYILELPKEVMNSPIGALIMPMIQGLETSLRAGAVPQPPQIRPASAPVAAAAVTATQPSAHDVEARSPAGDEPEAPSANDVEARSPAADEPEAPSANDVERRARPSAADEPEAGKTPGNGGDDGSAAIPPAVKPAAAAAQVSAAHAVVAAPPAPLAEAKRQVQEEIKREFAAIMAAGKRGGCPGHAPHHGAARPAARRAARVGLGSAGDAAVIAR